MLGGTISKNSFSKTGDFKQSYQDHQSLMSNYLHLIENASPSNLQQLQHDQKQNPMQS